MKFELERFKQSNVARIFVAYAVVAFGLMQIFDYLLPIIEAPLWVAQTLTLLLFLGFPISLLVGWVTQRPVVSAGSAKETNEPSYAHSMSRQRLILIGLGSSAIFGFLGFISMPYLLDQASFNNRVVVAEPNVLQSPARRGVRTELNLGTTGLHGFFGIKTEIALSPDGTKLAYIEYVGSGGNIYLRDLLNLDSVRLLVTMQNPASGRLSFSSDGEWVVYLDDRRLNRVRIEGGAPQELSPNRISNGGVAATEDAFYFSTNGGAALSKLSLALGGEIEELISGSTTFWWPRVLPGDTHLLVTTSADSNSVGATGTVELIDLSTLERKVLLESAFNARYAATGHIVFSRDASIWAVPFDLAMMEITGDQVPVVQGVETDQRRGAAIYSFSEDGRLAYLRGEEVGSGSGGLALAKISRDGSETDIVDLETGLYGNLSLSPDERQVALTIFQSPTVSDVWLWDLNRDILGRRTFEGNASRPIWSPDGQNIIYRVLDSSSDDSPNGIWSIRANGTAQPVPLFLSDRQTWPRTISDDGDLIFTMNSGTLFETYTTSLGDVNNSAEIQAAQLDLAPEVNAYSGPILSPNNLWLAYSTMETGTPEVYVRPWPDIESGKWQVSIGGGYLPYWNKATNEILYQNMNGGRSRVVYREGQTESDNRPTFLEFDRPEVLASSPNVTQTENRLRAWIYRASMGDFLGVIAPNMAINEGLAADILSNQTTLVVVEEWFDELKSLVVAEPE